ncbi:MAG TPA: hypothetical protein VLA51_10480 [Paracoccaceae bacterium]|nr:hypothetical protein [Paracoccaceae bacterium]
MQKVDAKSGQAMTAIRFPEAFGVFGSFESLQKAFFGPRIVGFSRYDISTLAASIAATTAARSKRAVCRMPLARRAGKQHAKDFESQIKRGGIPLWVLAVDKEKERSLLKFLKYIRGAKCMCTHETNGSI